MIEITSYTRRYRTMRDEGPHLIGRIASKQDCKTVRQEAAYSGEDWAALFSRTSQGVVAIFAKSHTRQKPRHWPDTEPQNEAQPGNHGSVDTARGRRLARFTRDTPDKPDEVEQDRDLKPQSEEGGIGQAICDKARDYRRDRAQARNDKGGAD